LLDGKKVLIISKIVSKSRTVFTALIILHSFVKNTQLFVNPAVKKQAISLPVILKIVKK